MANRPRETRSICPDCGWESTSMPPGAPVMCPYTNRDTHTVEPVASQHPATDEGGK